MSTQVYLDGTDTESEPIEDPVETETPESPLVVAPPTSLPKSTLPTLVYILRRTARIVVCVPPAMSPGLSASMAEVAAMSESRFKEDDDEEDEEIEESLDSDSVSEDAEDKGPTTEDEDPAAGDERLAAVIEGPDMDDESHGMDDESHGLDDESHGLDDEGHSVESDGLGLEEEEEAVPPAGSSGCGDRYPKDGMVYIDVPAYPLPAPPSLEWTSGSLPISPSPSIVPLPVSSPIISLTVPSPVATPATTETEGFFIKTLLQKVCWQCHGRISSHVADC
ncbi:hypothetical protein Tco_0255612 [Tanacetum coccineum]